MAKGNMDYHISQFLFFDCLNMYNIHVQRSDQNDSSAVLSHLALVCLLIGDRSIMTGKSDTIVGLVDSSSLRLFCDYVGLLMLSLSSDHVTSSFAALTALGLRF